ncbi:methyltransferase [Spirochaeta africana]|uniref:16S RNA G1207 methylase RsmC n=1 Tax=Spirochaeta africana (strain ATCC 700263 / DSM 8902 / Z-7692) TaxID=889378 RepID=H9UH30_SPIAZ|nr:methyltransferase [Spirochaeta africana]AFG36823.1 16S RNA G1207 methylase RsmC [Spirochaeta africana DSM 8902]
MTQSAEFPQGTLQLQRYPDTGNPTLRAWDAADELLLQRLAATGTAEIGRVLIVHDNFGALGCALQGLQPDWHHDSLLAATALTGNLRLNGLEPAGIRRVALEQAAETAPGTVAERRYDTILLKMPKQLAYLEYLLRQLRARMHPDSRLLLGGMSRAVPRAVYELCGQLFSDGDAGRAVKKARVIELGIDRLPEEAPPAALACAEQESWEGVRLVKLPNTFARRQLDVGSRLLAELLIRQGAAGVSTSAPGAPPAILDIGCGNGLLSAAAGLAWPRARITAIDESYLAVKSAAASLAATAAANPGYQSLATAQVLQMDGGDMRLSDSYDLMLCNPPFHEQGAVNRRLAQRLLQDARRLLTDNGLVLVVANTSLGYAGVLRRDGWQVAELARRSGFSVLELRSP